MRYGYTVSPLVLKGYLACYAAHMTDRTTRQDATGMTDSQNNRTSPGEDGVTMVDVPEAARRLGVTPDAIRSRLHRGTLEGEKIAGAWRVRLLTVMDQHIVESAPTGTRQGTDGHATGKERHRQDAGDGGDRTRQDASTIDLSPLAETIERLSRHNAELSAAAGMWQARALHLEEQVRQLTATAGSPPDDDVSRPERVEHEHQDGGEAQGSETPQGSAWSRLRRWWTGT